LNTEATDFAERRAVDVDVDVVGYGYGYGFYDILRCYCGRGLSYDLIF